MDTVEDDKALGCLIAIDDFGAGHSNFSRIWRDKSIKTFPCFNRDCWLAFCVFPADNGFNLFA